MPFGATPADKAYIQSHNVAELVDNMLRSLLDEKPDNAAEFCADFLKARVTAEWKLHAHPTIPRATKPVVVCILDGWGDSPIKDQYNAIHAARTPVFDRLWAVPGRARTVLAHGPAVGLPSKDDMGNSEVGHNALGSGQVVAQGAKLVDNSLGDGSIFKSPGWKYIEPQWKAGFTVHLIGLLTKGGVHARYDQMIGVIRGLAGSGAKRVRLHLLTDGRDVPDGSSVQYAAELERDLEEVRGKGVDVRVASGGGRMGVTMDRYEADWGIVEKGWKAHVLGEAPHRFRNFSHALEELKKADGNAGSDQFLPPFVIAGEDGQAVGPVNDGDAVIVFNFRADRVIEISKAFEYENFKGFDRKRWPKVKFVGMMQYDGDLKLPSNYLVDAPTITRTSGEYLCKNAVRTFAVSETQKFGHVTFFWNGNRSEMFDAKLETYFCEESDKVVFDEKPLMKAREVTDAAVEAIKSGRFDMVRVNYANPDMVGHTGNLAATIEAVECCDKCLGELLAATESVGGRWLVSSDHGNADEMVQREKKTKAPLKSKETGQIQTCTTHTLNPVPVMIGGSIPTGTKFREQGVENAGLANITATFINLLGLEAPEIYEPSLI